MHQIEVEFENAGTRLLGTLSLPDGDGPWPGLVALHGSSDGTRDFRLHARLESLLVPAGFAVLRYDRRGTAPSGGDFASADFALMAADALAALSTMVDDPHVDPARVGLYGFSQGAWIAPEAASRSEAVAFMVLVGACAVTPAAQMSYAAATALRAAGFDEAAVDQAQLVRALVDDAVRGRVERDEAQAALRTVADEPWFGLSSLSPPGEHGSDTKWRLEMDYDVAPILAELSVPVLLIHGDHDRWVPVDESERIWQDAYRDRGQLLTAVRLAGTGHFPTLARGKEGEEAAPISPDYEALMLRWLRATV
jgi:uncharacterized protein